MPNPILSVKNLRVKLDRHLILKNVNFEVQPDEILAVIGPNGAGKTVLFRALLNLIPYTGEVNWQTGVKIGYVPQKLSINSDLPLTTLEFFKFKERNLTEIKSALFSVGFQKEPHPGHLMNHVLKQKIGLLSGGELQRILIAWALLGHPQILLFDEPTSGIDISAEETIYSLLHKLRTENHLAVMLISHELEIVSRYADNVLCLNKKTVCFGSPQTALKPQNLEKIFGPEIGIYHHHDH